jgi:hypothetical protein
LEGGGGRDTSALWDVSEVLGVDIQRERGVRNLLIAVFGRDLGGEAVGLMSRMKLSRLAAMCGFGGNDDALSPKDGLGGFAIFIGVLKELGGLR